MSSDFLRVLIVCWIIYLTLSVIGRIVAARRRKKREKERLMLIHQQQEMLKSVTGVNVDFTPMLANVGVKKKQKNIGWIILFVLLFAYLFFLAYPWIRALALLGVKDFIRMIQISI